MAAVAFPPGQQQPAQVVTAGAQDRLIQQQGVLPPGLRSAPSGPTPICRTRTSRARAASCCSHREKGADNGRRDCRPKRRWGGGRTCSWSTPAPTGRPACERADCFRCPLWPRCVPSGIPRRPGKLGPSQQATYSSTASLSRRRPARPSRSRLRTRSRLMPRMRPMPVRLMGSSPSMP